MAEEPHPFARGGSAAAVYALRHLAAIAALPVMVAVVVPALLLSSTPGAPPSGAIRIVTLFGAVVFFVIGLTLFVSTVALFMTVGRGTLAPWDPPRRLVVRGVYRHVRNPMISGVVSILLAESLLFGSAAIFRWFLVFAAANLVYIPIVEEPMLERRFGEDYELYRRHVPRWIPRLKPWEGVPERIPD